MNVMSYLFGSILTLNRTDLWLVLTVTIFITLFVLIFYKELFLLTFDEDAASVNGLPVRFLNIALTVMTALVVSVAIKIVGALLVSALLILPAACSLTLGKGFRPTLWISVLFSEAAVVGGLIVSGLFNLASGGMIVLLLIAFLLVTLIIRRGVKV